jgi:hypothetical protein
MRAWLITSLGIAGFVSASCITVSAQVNITLPQTNIQNAASYATTQNSGSYSAGLSVGPTIKLAGSSPILFQASTGNSFPVNNLGIQLSMIGGVNLLSGSTAIDLSTTAQTIFTSTLSIGSGTIQLTYTVPVAGYNWVAGTYTTNLVYTLTSIGLGASIASPGLLTITIPAYIVAPTTIPAITLNVNSLNYFSTQTITSSSLLAYSATVPYSIGLNGNNSNFTYNTTLGLSTPANLTLGNVHANLNNGANINLSNAAQSLTTTPISVGAGNNQDQTLNFSISPAGLVSQFVQTGIYSVPITLTTSDARSSPSVVNQTTTSTLNVTVADMQAFTMNDATTTLNLNSISGYQGITQAQPNHMTVSSTSPWSISVVAASSNLSNGSNTIPVNYISIGNVSGQTLLTNTILSSGSQTITSSRPPAINQSVGVNYTISAANAQQLINKPSGTYSTTLTYTLSAL